MTKKRHTPEQIVTLLRQVEVAVSNGKSTRKPAKRPRLPSRRITAGEKSMAASNWHKRND